MVAATSTIPVIVRQVEHGVANWQENYMPKGFDNVPLLVVDIFSDYVVDDIQFTNKRLAF